MRQLYMDMDRREIVALCRQWEHRIAELEKRILDAPAIIGKELQRQYPSVDYLSCIAQQEAESALGIANYRPDKREVK